MFMKNWKREILTIPNLLSLFRLVLIPFYMVIYLNATKPFHFLKAGTIMAISCLTDAVDGKIARRFHMVTNIGKILDPLADKITQFALTLCLCMKYPILNPVLILFVIKEVFQLTLGIINLKKGKMLSGALISGKICTTVLFISLIFLVLFPTIQPAIVTSIAITDSLFLAIAFANYIHVYLGNKRNIQNLDFK